MARKSKETADYFPHMATATAGKTLFVIESEHGNDGYAFWFKLLEALCQADGHYIRLGSAADLRYLSARARVATDTAVAILDLLAELEAIDQELWAEERMVWCQNLVDNLKPMYERRTGGLPKRPGTVADSLVDGPEIPLSETPSCLVSGDIMHTENDTDGISVDILHTETPLTTVFDDGNRQSKVKESKDKVKEIIKPLVPPLGDEPAGTEESPKPPAQDKTSRIFDPASPEYKLAAYLLSKIRELDRKAREPNLQLWAMDIDKMIRLDKRSPAEVKDLIDFAHSDSFWRSNILSASKLREKATALTAKMIENAKRGGASYGVNAKPAGKGAEAAADPRFDASKYCFRSDG